jgi:hypothetical protein
VPVAILSFTFSVSEASVVVRGEDPSEIQSPFLERKGERCMKDTVHHAVPVLFISAVKGSCTEHGGCVSRDD